MYEKLTKLSDQTVTRGRGHPAQGVERRFNKQSASIGLGAD